MIKAAFKLYAFCAIISPWVFLALRALGIYNFRYDAFVFFGLFIISFITMFLTYRNWD